MPEGAAQDESTAAGSREAQGPERQAAAFGGHKDREPPPSYDGVEPETTFRQYEKNVKFWQLETDVPGQKQGTKLMRAVTGTARLAVDSLEFEEVASEDGVSNAMRKLREFSMPHLEVSLPRVFEVAIHGQPRHKQGGICRVPGESGDEFRHSE